MASGTGLGPRTRPMEVLVLGLSRTGTTSIKKALEDLGYINIYHASDIFRNPHDAEKWTAALEARYEEKGKEFGREEFDDILGNYSALTDMPASCFATELIAAYPEAKIILSSRPPESWFTSMNETLWATETDPFKPWKVFWAPPIVKGFARCFETVFETYFYGNFPRYGKRVFREHNERVRAAAPIDRFLEFHPKDGWGPLCEFLGKEVPEGDFPRLNDTKTFQQIFKSGQKSNRIKKIGIAVVVAVPVIIGTGLMCGRAMEKVKWRQCGIFFNQRHQNCPMSRIT